MRTERHKTPLQIFVEKSLELSLSNILPLKEVVDHPCNDINQEWNNNNAIEVPSITCPFPDNVVDIIKQRFNPLDDTGDRLGITTFLQLLDYINEI